MSTLYTDFFMRPNNTSEEGTIPSTGSITNCPDIIPYGVQGVEDPQTTFGTTASYNTNPGVDLKVGMNNLIYVRAKNGYEGQETANIYLYYVPCQVINWPNQWANNGLMTDQADPQQPRKPEDYYVSISASAKGDIKVGPNPFQWTPTPPPPGSDHYCLISRVETPLNPNPIPGIDQPMTYEDMADLVRNNIGFGWRNVTLIDSAQAPTWSYQTMLTVPTNVTAETVHIYLACNNMPKGSYMEFNCSTQKGSSAPIQIPKTSIDDPYQISGTTVILQPGFSGSITVYYWSNGKAPVSGSFIQLEASIESGGNPALKKMVEKEHLKKLSAAKGITPTAPVYIGNYIFKYK